MEGFSTASAAATCSAISKKANETAFAIDTVAAEPRSSGHPDVQKELAFLSIRLQQLCQHSDQLASCLVDDPVVSPKLQAILAQVLPECDKAVTDVADEVSRVRSGSVTHAINLMAVSQYQRLVAAYSRIVIFASQLSTIDIDEEQESKLAHADAHQLLETVDTAAQHVRISSGIFVAPN
ncbi:hypothetical protein B0H63DRAFT_456753 [Podospora didyma]|uniref:Uncharacterized protein n=1 Tax=Podospora didyma TaxID=330526 RepID=A0AAE0U6Y3_9PEZI|nr:hypothetical protein B0H63DRAFT_456753 [Podospora didyma]